MNDRLRPKKWNRTAAAVIGVALVAALFAGLLWPRRQQPAQAGLVGLPQYAGDFARAVGPYDFSFPRDHGPHPDFQTEWWYYTGNLETPDGRHFGYQLTFFRRAVSGPDQRQPRASNWAAEQIYMAHFTLTDVSGQDFRFSERFQRGAAGLAGAESQPAYRVWLGDWSVVQTGEADYRLQAAQDGVSLDLLLVDRTGPVLQGDAGLSLKGPEPGNASYYYSQPRLETTGTVSLDGESFSVRGLSWLDREFSTSLLSDQDVGWDWFALQLDDGSELMLFHLRRKDGSISSYSSGALIRPDGTTRVLKRDEFQLVSTQTWRSPHTDAQYPSGWEITIPSEQISLTVRPYTPDQELRVSYVYWEGAVQVSGQRANQALSGSGYAELTGYAAPMSGRL